MRYPVGQSGTKEEFDKLWYNAQDFGAKTSYGFHEGTDLNLKTGGDTDLGQPLYAVANGKIVYYHDASHPTTGFGRHMVLECQTPFGVRWYHYAHCQEITAKVKDVTEGEIIGKLGKSGTTYAHLHFAVFKVDPSTLRNGIDTIAKTEDELNKWWENPFLTLNSQPQVGKEIPHWLTTILAEFGLSIEQEAEIRSLFEKARKYDQDILSLQEQLKSANETLSEKSIEVSDLITKNQNLQGKIDALEEQLGKTQLELQENKTKLFSTELELRKINQERGKKEKMIEDITSKYEALKIDYKRLEDDFKGNASFWKILGILLSKIFKNGKGTA